MRTIEGGELSPKDLSLLESGESAVFAARPSYVTVEHGSHWDLPLLLLTNRRMIVSKDKLIGKPKANFSAEWSDVIGVSGELWHGGGPQIQLIVRTRRGDVELIVQPHYAVEVESAIRGHYLR